MIGLWIILAVIFGISAIILLVILIMYRKEVRRISDELKFIRKNNTNAKVTENMHFKEVPYLIDEINDYISEQKDYRIKLENTNDLFKQTITSISHDLRTPLTSASGYIQMANKPEVSEETRKKYLEIISLRIDSVKALLEQLFEYARIESNEYQLSLSNINSCNILCDAISMFYDEFTEHGIEPKISIPDTAVKINADADALKRVFLNIICNAIKYGTGTFAVRLTEKNGVAKFIFENETDKLSESDVSKIFDRFYTSDLSRTKKSTGLGLAIAKQFVVKMNAEINADYRKGIFIIEIKFKTVKQN